MESRDHIRRDGVEGKSVINKLARIKRMTAVSIFLAKTRLGQGVLNNIEETYDTNAAKEQEAE